MAWWDTVKRIGKAGMTAGMSEIIPGFDAGQKAPIDPSAGRLTDADKMRDMARLGYGDAGRRGAPQAGRTMVGGVQTGQAAQIAGGPQDQFRQQQVALANRLMGIGTGAQMGAGEMAVQRQGQRAVAQQQAMARMGRGGNAATAARMAAQNVGDIGLNVAGQGAQAALSDQQMALGQLGQVSAAGRGQDLDLAAQNANLKQQMNLANLSSQNQAIFQQAGLDQATSLANMQAKLAQTGLNDQAQIAYMAQLLGISTAEMQGRLAQEGLKVQNYDPGWGREFLGQALQAGGQAAASGAMASDRAFKTDVRRVSRQIDDMLDKLVPSAARYKNPDKHGAGRRAMIMAQDLERSEAGKSIVRQKPDGKYVDVNAGLSAALASVARLHERVKAVEKGK